MLSADTLTRIVPTIPRPVWRIVLLPLLLVPSFRRAHEAIQHEHQIARLEAKADFEAARTVRRHALTRVEPAVSTSLWRSEGFDQLRLGNSLAALQAFERGISHLGESAAMYGVSQPHELYYGAALAALGAGEVEKARGHYRLAVNAVSSLGRESKGNERLAWLLDRLETLRCTLDEPARL